MATDTETFRTTFAGVFRVEGDAHPRLHYRHEADRGDGVTKTLSGAVEVREEATLLRVERELRRGDEIEITCETDWDSTGVPTTLVGFVKVRRLAGAPSRGDSSTPQRSEHCPDCGHVHRKTCVEIVKERINGTMTRMICGCTHRRR